MSDQKERSVEGVLQEMQRVGEAVDIARRVVVVGAGHRSLLAAELGSKLAHLGLKVELIEPNVVVPFEQEEAKGGLYKSFADVLACPSLAHLFGDKGLPCESVLVGDPQPVKTLQSAPAPPDPMPEPQSLDPEPTVDLGSSTASVPAFQYRDVLMGYPETWKVGDLFEDHPRYTLPHKVRKWELESFDAENVTLRSPNCSSSDLISLEIFQKRYVFHSRAESAAE